MHNLQLYSNSFQVWTQMFPKTSARSVTRKIKLLKPPEYYAKRVLKGINTANTNRGDNIVVTAGQKVHLYCHRPSYWTETDEIAKEVGRFNAWNRHDRRTTILVDKVDSTHVWVKLCQAGIQYSPTQQANNTRRQHRLGFRAELDQL